MENISLDGKTAVITGASKGLGKAMALALAQAGARLALISRDAQLLEQTAAETRALGATVHAYVADLLQEQAVNNLGRQLAADFGKIQILINNAGVNVRKAVTDFTLDEWRMVLDTNLTGAFLMCRAVIPLMTGQGWGRILNMTSIMSHVALAGRSAYAASKAGLLGFTKALALELAPEGITVNGISPGPFATEMNRPLLTNPELSQFFLSRIPLGQWGQVEDIGALAVFLCSDHARFITGADILVDGGWTAQ